jgi:DNA-binding transcriptional ArsR family regulator
MQCMPSRDSSDVAVPDVSELDLFAIMGALSSPARRSMVLTLAKRDGVPCGQFGLSIAKSTAARHFRVLQEVGLIRQWEDGNIKRNGLRRDEIEQRFPGLLDMVLREGRTTP